MIFEFPNFQLENSKRKCYFVKMFSEIFEIQNGFLLWMGILKLVWPFTLIDRKLRFIENDGWPKMLIDRLRRLAENDGGLKLTMYRKWRWIENDNRPKMTIDRKLTIDRKWKYWKLLQTLSLANGLRDLSLDSWRIWPPWIEIKAVSPPNWIRIWLKYI